MLEGMLTAEMINPDLVPLQEQTAWFCVRFNPTQICVQCELSHLVQRIHEHLVVCHVPTSEKLHPQLARAVCKALTLPGRFGQNLIILGQTLSWQLGVFEVRFSPP